MDVTVNTKSYSLGKCNAFVIHTVEITVATTLDTLMIGNNTHLNSLVVHYVNEFL